jgi:type I restriction enzyme S subunit
MPAGQRARRPRYYRVPALAGQSKVMKALSVGEQKIAGEEKRKAALQALFKTMLHHLMTGKIRVKDL